MVSVTTEPTAPGSHRRSRRLVEPPSADATATGAVSARVLLSAAGRLTQHIRGGPAGRDGHLEQPLRSAVPVWGSQPVWPWSHREPAPGSVPQCAESSPMAPPNAACASFPPSCSRASEVLGPRPAVRRPGAGWSWGFKQAVCLNLLAITAYGESLLHAGSRLRRLATSHHAAADRARSTSFTAGCG
jgi:hypothetical protein